MKLIMQREKVTASARTVTSVTLVSKNGHDRGAS